MNEVPREHRLQAKQPVLPHCKNDKGSKKYLKKIHILHIQNMLYIYKERAILNSLSSGAVF